MLPKDWDADGSEDVDSDALDSEEVAEPTEEDSAGEDVLNGDSDMDTEDVLDGYTTVTGNATDTFIGVGAEPIPTEEEEKYSEEEDAGEEDSISIIAIMPDATSENSAEDLKNALKENADITEDAIEEDIVMDAYSITDIEDSVEDLEDVIKENADITEDVGEEDIELDTVRELQEDATSEDYAEDLEDVIEENADITKDVGEENGVIIVITLGTEEDSVEDIENALKENADGTEDVGTKDLEEEDVLVGGVEEN